MVWFLDPSTGGGGGGGAEGAGNQTNMHQC